jgi:cyclophilin family peptidyl-prolyl cis-trans isomerase
VSLRAFAIWLSLALTLSMAAPVGAQDPPPNPRVLVETTKGDFEIELFRNERDVIATVVNFLGYVRAGYYDGTVFHRTMRDVLIQGGGFMVGEDEQLVAKTEGLRGQIVNQATRNHQNRRGTIAMARGSAPDSARQQFFINLEDNSSFDFKNPTPAGIGYAVFGRVTDGMNVVRDIGRVRTGSQAPDIPNEPVVITSITLVQAGP